MKTVALCTKVGSPCGPLRATISSRCSRNISVRVIIVGVASSWLVENRALSATLLMARMLARRSSSNCSTTLGTSS